MKIKWFKSLVVTAVILGFGMAVSESGAHAEEVSFYTSNPVIIKVKIPTYTYQDIELTKRLLYKRRILFTCKTFGNNRKRQTTVTVNKRKICNRQ